MMKMKTSTWMLPHQTNHSSSSTPPVTCIKPLIALGRIMACTQTATNLMKKFTCLKKTKTRRMKKTIEEAHLIIITIAITTNAPPNIPMARTEGGKKRKAKATGMEHAQRWPLYLPSIHLRQLPHSRDEVSSRAGSSRMEGSLSVRKCGTASLCMIYRINRLELLYD